MALFRAETVEELEHIKALEVPEMEQAINAYYKIIASPEFRELERLREKTRHDEAQALHHRNVEIAKLMLADGEPVYKVARYTGLPVSELEKYP